MGDPTVAAACCVCSLCKRKFKTAELLARHKHVSELHRRNLAKGHEDMQHRKDELQQEIFAMRKQIKEVEDSACKEVLDVEEAELQGKRSALDCELEQALTTLTAVQESLEEARAQQLLARGGTAGSFGAAKPGLVLKTQLEELAYFCGVACWQGNKEVQEDRYCLDICLEAHGNKSAVGYMVLDGHSGSLCVDLVLESLPRNLQKCLSTKPYLSEEYLRQTVTEACLLTDEEFLIKARAEQVTDGSTCILALMFPDDMRAGVNRVLIANIGDSRAVLCRSGAGGQLTAKRVSEDHKPGRADERERIESVGGVVDMQGVWRVFTPSSVCFGGRSLTWGLAVSRAFGNVLMKEPRKYGCSTASGELVSADPEIDVCDLVAGEDRFLILACDGIWDVLEDDDAVAVCLEHPTADLAAHALVRRAFQKGSDDNLTAMVIVWHPSSSVLGVMSQPSVATLAPKKKAKRARSPDSTVL